MYFSFAREMYKSTLPDLNVHRRPETQNACSIRKGGRAIEETAP
jgi:hypothetical protein